MSQTITRGRIAGGSSMSQRIPDSDELQHQIELLHADNDTARKTLFEQLVAVDDKARKPLVQRIVTPAIRKDGKAPDSLLQLLIDLNNKGDITARNELVGLFWNRLLAIVRGYFPADDNNRRWLESDDVRQVASMQVVDALNKGQIWSVGGFMVFAANRIHHVVIDFARSCRRRFGYERRHHTPGPGEDVGSILEAHGTAEGPLDLLGRKEALALMEKLPERKKAVVYLYFFYGLTVDETAKRLGIPKSTTSRYLRESLIRLRKMVKHDHQ
jgi:RNA polymerase sigma factor (sigma-70 family)